MPEQLTREQIEALLLQMQRQNAGPRDIKVDFGAPPGGGAGEDDQLRMLLEMYKRAGAGGEAPGRDPIRVDFGGPRRELGGIPGGGIPPGITPPTPPTPPSLLGGLPPELSGIPPGGLSGDPFGPSAQGVQDMTGMFDPTTITGAPFQPPPQLPSQNAGTWPTPPARAGPGPPPAADPAADPTAPDSRLGAPPFDEQGGYSGGRLRFPGEAPGELPAAPEKEGDLSRGRASRELEKLYAAQALSEGLGGMEVVTAGDILHRTAKGVGPSKPRGQALRGLTDFKAKEYLGGIGQKDALALQGLKGEQALEQIGLKEGQQVIGGLTEDQRTGMDAEARAWRTNVRVRKLQEASDAAQGLLSMVQVPGTIAHAMAGRMLLAASGEERYSEQDIKGVEKSQGLVQGWWDYMIKKVPGDMSERLKAEYTRVAVEMKRIKDVALHRIAKDWSEGYSVRSGIPAARISNEAYSMDPSKEPPSSPASPKPYEIEDTSTGVRHPATKEQWEEAKLEPAGSRLRAVPKRGSGLPTGRGL